MKNEPDSGEGVGSVLPRLHIATLILGSGAESMSGTDKARMINFVLRSCSVAFEKMVTLTGEVDLAGDLEKLTTEMRKADPSADLSELTIEKIKFANAIMFKLLPLAVPLETLRTRSSTRVLVSSLRAFGDAKSPLDKMFLAIWALLVSPPDGANRFKEIFNKNKELASLRFPIAIVLRSFVSASYFDKKSTSIVEDLAKDLTPNLVERRQLQSMPG